MQHETVWLFRPEENWDQGPHAVLVDPVLEDLAGNNLVNPFDLRTEPGAEGRGVMAENAEHVRIEFEVEVGRPLRVPLM